MKNKKQKKLVVLAAMGALLALVGVSGSQTYAKYIESKTVKTEQATVAKWGYVVTADASKFFGKGHKVPASSTSVVAHSEGVTVKAHSGKVRDLVAPGTEGYFDVFINGSSEVLSKYSFEISGDSQPISLVYNGSVCYEPLKWTATLVHEGGAAEELCENATWKDFASAVTLSKSITLNADANATLHVSYSWPFESENDLYDTYLGKIAAGGDADDNLPAGYTSDVTVKLGFKVTLEQVQA